MMLLLNEGWEKILSKEQVVDKAQQRTNDAVKEYWRKRFMTPVSSMLLSHMQKDENRKKDMMRYR